MTEPANRPGPGVRLVVQVDADQHPLWRDGLETYAGVVAELLAAHHWSEGHLTCGACSWSPSAVDPEERRRQHCEHQATVLPALELHPHVHSDVTRALLDVTAAQVELSQREQAAILAAHTAGWSFHRIAGVLGSSYERVRRLHGVSTRAPGAPVVHRVDGPPSDRGAA